MRYQQFALQDINQALESYSTMVEGRIENEKLERLVQRVLVTKGKLLKDMQESQAAMDVLNRFTTTEE